VFELLVPLIASRSKLKRWPKLLAGAASDEGEPEGDGQTGGARLTGCAVSRGHGTHAGGGALERGRSPSHVAGPSGGEKTFFARRPSCPGVTRPDGDGVLPAQAAVYQALWSPVAHVSDASVKGEKCATANGLPG
jgi:hypothetical protein